MTKQKRHTCLICGKKKVESLTSKIIDRSEEESAKCCNRDYSLWICKEEFEFFFNYDLGRAKNFLKKLEYAKYSKTKYSKERIDREVEGWEDEEKNHWEVLQRIKNR